MAQNTKLTTVKTASVLMLVLLNVIIVKAGFITNDKWYWLLWVTIPLLIIAVVLKNSKPKIAKPSSSQIRYNSPWRKTRRLLIRPYLQRSVIKEPVTKSKGNIQKKLDLIIKSN